MVKIQKNMRRCMARKNFHNTKSSALVLQTGLRAMVSRDDFRFKRQSKAVVTLQVITWFCNFHLNNMYVLLLMKKKITGLLASLQSFFRLSKA